MGGPGSLSSGSSGLTLLFLEPQGTYCYRVSKGPGKTSGTCHVHLSSTGVGWVSGGRLGMLGTTRGRGVTAEKQMC